MRNKHQFKVEIPIRCPFEACGKYFIKHATVEFETNQKGDVISKKLI